MNLDKEGRTPVSPCFETAIAEGTDHDSANAARRLVPQAWGVRGRGETIF